MYFTARFQYPDPNRTCIGTAMEYRLHTMTGRKTYFLLLGFAPCPVAVGGSLRSPPWTNLGMRIKFVPFGPQKATICHDSTPITSAIHHVPPQAKKCVAIKGFCECHWLHWRHLSAYNVHWRHLRTRKRNYFLTDMHCDAPNVRVSGPFTQDFADSICK